MQSLVCSQVQQTVRDTEKFANFLRMHTFQARYKVMSVKGWYEFDGSLDFSGMLFLADIFLLLISGAWLKFRAAGQAQGLNKTPYSPTRFFHFPARFLFLRQSLVFAPSRWADIYHPQPAFSPAFPYPIAATPFARDNSTFTVIRPALLLGSRLVPRSRLVSGLSVSLGASGRLGTNYSSFTVPRLRH